jgi:hypothetical protein
LINPSENCDGEMINLQNIFDFCQTAAATSVANPTIEKSLRALENFVSSFSAHAVFGLTRHPSLFALRFMDLCNQGADVRAKVRGPRSIWATRLELSATRVFQLKGRFGPSQRHQPICA